MGISIIRCDTCDEWKATRKFRITGTSGGSFDFHPICIECEDPLNADVHDLERDDLIAEVKKLRKGIRDHRDAQGHALCWWVPELWGLLPEKITPKPEVPPTKEFLAACKLYRKSLG
jgi:hypothetical protein